MATAATVPIAIPTLEPVDRAECMNVGDVGVETGAAVLDVDVEVNVDDVKGVTEPGCDLTVAVPVPLPFPVPPPLPPDPLLESEQYPSTHTFVMLISASAVHFSAVLLVTQALTWFAKSAREQ